MGLYFRMRLFLVTTELIIGRNFVFEIGRAFIWRKLSAWKISGAFKNTACENCLNITM